MLCVGLRDGEDRDLSTMGFTARQSGCLILLRNLLMYFSSTLSWSGSPEKSFFFFFSFLPFCCLEGKKKLGCQCSEIPVWGETWGIWTSKVLFNSFVFITVCLLKDHLPLPAQTSFCQDGRVQLSCSTERIWRFNCLSTNAPLYLYFQRDQGCQLLSKPLQVLWYNLKYPHCWQKIPFLSAWLIAICSKALQLI